MSSSGQGARESNVQLPGAVFPVLSQLPHLCGWEGLCDSSPHLSCCDTSPNTSAQSGLGRRQAQGTHLSLQGFGEVNYPLSSSLYLLDSWSKAQPG